MVKEGLVEEMIFELTLKDKKEPVMQEQKAQGTTHGHDWRQARSKRNRARPETSRVSLGHRRTEERETY